MTHQERLSLVKKHYCLNAARDTAVAKELLTHASHVANPSYMLLRGTCCSKGASRELLPLVRQIVASAGPVLPGATSGEDQAVELCEFTLEGGAYQPTQLAELIHFWGNQICEIRPHQSDPKMYVDAAARREAQ